MFEEFKAAHGGYGPFQLLGDAATHGALLSRARAGAIQQSWTDTLSSLESDPTLPDEFKNGAVRDAHRLRNLSPDQAIGVIQKLSTEAGAQRAISSAFGPVVSSAQALHESADDPVDKQVLSSLLANAQAAHALALDPATRQEGMQMLGKVADGVTAWTVKTKENEVAANTKAAEMARDLTNTQRANFKDDREDFQRTSAPFLAVSNAFQTIRTLAALPNPTPQTDQALARAAGQVFSPGVPVRPGEDAGEAFWSAMGPIGEAAKFIATGGTKFTDEDRAALIYAATQRASEENQTQSARNGSALQAARADGLPEKYLDQLSMPLIDLGELGGLPVPKGGPPKTGGGDGTTTATGGPPEDRAAQLGAGVVRGAFNTLSDIGAELGKPVGDAIRTSVGQPTNADTFKDTSGAIYRRVDRGDGRAEWQLYKPAPNAATPRRNEDEIQVSGTTSPGDF